MCILGVSKGDQYLVDSMGTSFLHLRVMNVRPLRLNLFLETNYLGKYYKTGVISFTKCWSSRLQIVILVLYHLQTKSPGLARKGFFHWRNHVATFIDRNWEVLFPSDIKKKKKWTGTIAGTLSHFSSYIFLSGTSTFNEPAWWTLMYPKLSPLATSHLCKNILFFTFTMSLV